MLAQQLADWSALERQTYQNLHHSNYWLSVPLEEQVSHARFIMAADKAHKNPAIMTSVHDFEAITELTILAQDHPRLLSIVAGACAHAGANIVGAQIFTMRDGRALDIILINRSFEHDEDEVRRGSHIASLIEKALSNRAPLPAAPILRDQHKRTRRAFAATIAPHIDINNNLSDKFSVIEVEGLDAQGLLSTITAGISDLSLDIASAYITTFGEKVRDSFYVTDLGGNKIENEALKQTIVTRLTSLMQA